ncbi:MAG: sensor histidine kinase [Actinomycetes bacterium]
MCALFAVTTYALARGYLLAQRERTVLRGAFADANYLQDRLLGRTAGVSEVLEALAPNSDHAVLVRHDGRWHTSSSLGPSDVPAALRREVEAGRTARVRWSVNGEPRVIVGVPVPSVDASVYDVAPLSDLQRTLRFLGLVLISGAVVTSALAAALGFRLSRRVLQPLDQVAGTAAAIAGGNLSTRLPATRDPDLATIVGSFNSMVDALSQRIERDARFAGDVSHELRSPLTTLIGSVDLLDARRNELPFRARTALDLIMAELDRFRRLLDDLIELARSDAEGPLITNDVVSAGELLGQVLSASGRPSTLLSGDLDVPLRCDKVRLGRMFTNLFDNADNHGLGLVAVTVDDRGATVRVHVDDAGRGVPVPEREYIFDRFTTGRSGRGSSHGTGLGLALVVETVTAHGGSVWCTDRPGGGARFVVSLPEGDR